MKLAIVLTVGALLATAGIASAEPVPNGLRYSVPGNPGRGFQGVENNPRGINAYERGYGRFGRAGRADRGFRDGFVRREGGFRR